MQIDWVTAIAQIINFLILVYLLKRFLYGPIIRAMDEREAKIASTLAEAEKKKEEAEREMETCLRKNRELETLRKDKLVQIKNEAEIWKRDLLDKARDEVDQIQAAWKETVQREKNIFLQEIRRLSGEQACAIARRALTDLANESLDYMVTDVFLKRLQKIDEEEHSAFLDSLKRSGNRMVVHSSFDIPNEPRSNIIRILKNRFSENIDICFETSDDLIFGVEIMANDRKIAWTLRGYMEDLEKTLENALLHGLKESAESREENLRGKKDQH